MEEIEKEVMGEEQGRRKEQRMDDRAGDEESSEDEYGPPVPGQERNRGPKTRVTLPTQEDLLIQKGLPTVLALPYITLTLHRTGNRSPAARLRGPQT